MFFCFNYSCWFGLITNRVIADGYPAQAYDDHERSKYVVLGGSWLDTGIVDTCAYLAVKWLSEVHVPSRTWEGFCSKSHQKMLFGTNTPARMQCSHLPIGFTTIQNRVVLQIFLKMFSSPVEPCGSANLLLSVDTVLVPIVAKKKEGSCIPAEQSGFQWVAPVNGTYRDQNL